MATRPRTSSGKKKSGSRTSEQTPFEPPTLNDVVEEPGRDDQPKAMESEPVAEVTRTRLEQREIPSFSVSREQRIAEAAYWRAERRGFTPGHELDDWLEAERTIDDSDPGRSSIE